LCEEILYGVIFIFEDIKFNKSNTEIVKKDESKENINKMTPSAELFDLNKEIIVNLDNNNTDSIKEESKSIDDTSLSSKLTLIGHFLGQVIGTIKDCCRKAFLNGEPRQCNLCTFQISNEKVGKIH
jgi:hypothetical protein